MFMSALQKAEDVETAADKFQMRRPDLRFLWLLAQVKASTSLDVEILPKTVFGAAWEPQKERMDAAIYFPLYLVLATSDFRRYSIHYLSADLQPPELFVERKPLSSTARRAGWKGFNYSIQIVKDRFVRLI